MRSPGPIRLTVNGADHVLDVPGATPLLYVLRNDLGLTSPKYGCGLGECGSCTVTVDGVAARSCAIPAGIVENRRIVTLEGLGSSERPHPLQQAFVDEQAAQCGYCIAGMIMTAKALLDRDPRPSEAAIRNELRYNLCRCGTHVEIVRAVLRAAGRLDGAGQSAGASFEADLRSAPESPTENSHLPHPEVLGEAEPRRTHDGPACFEGRLRRPPQHEERGGSYVRSGSHEEGGSSPPGSKARRA